MSAIILPFRPRPCAAPAPAPPRGSMAGALERMVRAQMDAYPPHWTEAEKRELAERHLFGGDDAA